MESVTTETIKENNLLLETLLRLIKNVKGKIQLHLMGVMRRFVECLFSLVHLQDAGVKRLESVDNGEDIPRNKDLLKFVTEVCEISRSIIEKNSVEKLKDVTENKLTIELQVAMKRRIYLYLAYNSLLPYIEYSILSPKLLFSDLLQVPLSGKCIICRQMHICCLVIDSFVNY